MNMSKIITIIIPSYNVENTLEKAVNSLLIPDQKLRESIDVLIVNDGSSDGTSDLARKFERLHPGIVRVWNKENGGHGSTINVGIEQALGKYLKVVDGDDWLDTNSLESFIKVLQSTDADMVATDSMRYYMNDNITQQVKSSDLPYNKVMKFNEIWRSYRFDMKTFAVKTALLRNQPWRLNEHCYYDDNQLVLIAAMEVQTVLYVNLDLYVYRLQQSGQSVSIQGLLKHYKDHEKIMDAFIQWHHMLSDNNTVSGTRIHFFENYIKSFLRTYYIIGTQFNKGQRIEFLKQVNAYDEHLAKEDERLYAITNKCKLIFLCRFFHFSALVYSILCKILNITDRGLKF